MGSAPWVAICSAVVRSAGHAYHKRCEPTWTKSAPDNAQWKVLQLQHLLQRAHPYQSPGATSYGESSKILSWHLLLKIRRWEIVVSVLGQRCLILSLVR